MEMSKCSTAVEEKAVEFMLSHGGSDAERESGETKRNA